MGTYVLVHGAWHTGKELEPVAAVIRAEGHTVHAPTIKGNRPGDSKSVGLNDAIRSIADHLNESDLKEVVLLGHSYGGMIITGVADLLPDRIPRLVYWNAFVPNDGECLKHGAAALRRAIRHRRRTARRWFCCATVSDLARGVYQRR
jgi:pimeloyl-ACP methyl ester carboxylesterase